MPLAGPLNSRTRGYSRLAGRLQVPGQLGRLRRNRGIPPKTMFARPEDARGPPALGVRPEYLRFGAWACGVALPESSGGLRDWGTYTTRRSVPFLRAKRLP